MSRDNIVRLLKESPRLKTTKINGINVRLPTHIIHRAPGGTPDGALDDLSYRRLAAAVESSQMEYPLIAKPLVAASTRQSHQMVVAMTPSGLSLLPSSCIVQSYENHSGVMYKVYCIGGSVVRVFPRLSLPDLPLSGEDDWLIQDPQQRKDAVQFDSQEEYPKLEDFGVKRREGTRSTPNPNHSDLTDKDVTPLADVLRGIFKLDLFGFDLLYTNKGDWVVVDVNYFPSYKEMSEYWPRLLAEYLVESCDNNKTTNNNKSKITPKTGIQTATGIKRQQEIRQQHLSTSINYNKGGECGDHTHKTRNL